MKRKIFSQISLLLAIFTVAISLSACGTTKSTDSDTIDTNTNNAMDENSGIIQTTSTETAPNVSTSTPPVQNISTSTPTKPQGDSTSTPPQRPQGSATSTPPQRPDKIGTSTPPAYNQGEAPTPRTSQS